VLHAHSSPLNIQYHLPKHLLFPVSDGKELLLQLISSQISTKKASTEASDAGNPEKYINLMIKQSSVILLTLEYYQILLII
jgi:hypothetical protein